MNSLFSVLCIAGVASDNRINQDARDGATARALPDKFVWAPIGVHEISAGTSSGHTWAGRVVVNQQGADNVQRDFIDQLRAGYRPWVDFCHEDAEAAAWVRGFSFDSARGIICHIEWTPGGKEAVIDKEYFSFSPAFLVDRESGEISGLIFAKAVGGLVNGPAFRQMPPIDSLALAASHSAETSDYLKGLLASAKTPRERGAILTQILSAAENAAQFRQTI